MLSLAQTADHSHDSSVSVLGRQSMARGREDNERRREGEGHMAGGPRFTLSPRLRLRLTARNMWAGGRLRRKSRLTGGRKWSGPGLTLSLAFLGPFLPLAFLVQTGGCAALEVFLTLLLDNFVEVCRG